MKRIFMTLACAALLLASVLPSSAQKTRRNYVVGFYNLENLFDIYDDPVKNDNEFLPDGANQWTEVKYRKKLHNMAVVIAEMAKANGAFHTVLGVSEVENRLVLEDLISQPELAAANFRICHYDSPDRRGVDVAFLYRGDQFELISSEAVPYTFEGTAVKVEMTPEEQDYFRTRDIVMMYGKIDGEEFAFYVTHLPSRRGGKSGFLREVGAECIYRHIQMMRAEHPGIKIAVMGDMNDDPFDPSMAVYMHGRRNAPEVGPEDFFNPFWKMLDDGYGSLAYRDVWSIYDQILVSETLLNAPEGTLSIRPVGKKGYMGVVFKRPFMVTQKGQYKNYPFRTFSGGKFMNGYSDHYPTFVVIGK